MNERTKTKWWNTVIIFNGINNNMANGCVMLNVWLLFRFIAKKKMKETKTTQPRKDGNKMHGRMNNKIQNNWLSVGSFFHKYIFTTNYTANKLLINLQIRTECAWRFYYFWQLESIVADTLNTHQSTANKCVFRIKFCLFRMILWRI